jgi:ribonuclease VapC
VVLDSSAIVAIHLREPGYLQLIAKIQAAPVTVVGTPTLLETITVLSVRLGKDARPLVMAFLTHFQVEVVTFTELHLDAAVDAFLLYGRGRHPAALNFGDCMFYAIAVVAGMPLLFVGDDFAKTDLA